MAMRLPLLITIRERLEDAAATPLGSDAARDEYLVAAMHAHGASFSWQAASLAPTLA